MLRDELHQQNFSPIHLGLRADEREVALSTIKRLGGISRFVVVDTTYADRLPTEIVDILENLRPIPVRVTLGRPVGQDDVYSELVAFAGFAEAVGTRLT